MTVNLSNTRRHISDGLILGGESKHDNILYGIVADLCVEIERLQIAVNRLELRVY